MKCGLECVRFWPRANFHSCTKWFKEYFQCQGQTQAILHNFMVNSWVFKDDESETDAKSNSRHRVCLLLVGSPLLAWRVHAQSPPLAHCATLTPSLTHTHRVDRKLVHMGERKINITFFIRNVLLNIFMLNNFFGKSSLAIVKKILLYKKTLVLGLLIFLTKTLEIVILWFIIVNQNERNNS